MGIAEFIAAIAELIGMATNKPESPRPDNKPTAPREYTGKGWNRIEPPSPDPPATTDSQ